MRLAPCSHAMDPHPTSRHTVDALPGRRDILTYEKLVSSQQAKLSVLGFSEVC